MPAVSNPNRSPIFRLITIGSAGFSIRVASSTGPHPDCGLGKILQV